MVTLPLKSLFFSLSSCTTQIVCLHFHSVMIKPHCLCCWLATTIIHCLAEDFFIWCYCCRNISASPLIHQRNLFQSHLVLCVDICLWCVCFSLSNLVHLWLAKVTLSFSFHQNSLQNVLQSTRPANIALNIKAKLWKNRFPTTVFDVDQIYM